MEKTISFFADFYESVKCLPDADFGAVMRAAIEYQVSGEEYTGDNLFVKMAFGFAKRQADRKQEFSERKRANANKRWAKQEQSDSEQSDTGECGEVQDDTCSAECNAEDMQQNTNECKMMQDDANGMQNDAPIPNPSPSPNIINALSIAGAKGENFAEKPEDGDADEAAARQSRKSYGQFGWVKLTDKEYAAIVNDLGKAEAERCIAYVDECAQTTGNKNKWRDWNLVVRKCSRDKWGISAAKIIFPSRQRPERPGDIHGCGEPGPAELEAIARVLRETPEEFYDRSQAL